MTLKIGIPAQDQSDSKFGVNVNYLQFIYQFGRPVMILPETYDDFKEIYKLDALVVPGGADVDSKRYTNVPMYGNYNSNIYLEHFDTKILPNLVGKMPIFGICRGLQTLNVLFGGSLRNLWFHPYSQYDDQEVHMVWRSNQENWDRKNYLHKVNSFHHQAINKLADNFKSELVDFEDGVIEAISDNSKKIFAVQWHPERLKDDYSMNKFASILR